MEVLSGMLLWWWGIVLVLPYQTFATGAGYVPMAAYMPEPAWGLIFCGAAIVQSLAMCGNVHWFRYPGAMLALSLWAMVAWSFSLANPMGTGWGVYGLLAAAQAWVIIRGPQHDGKPSTRRRTRRRK